MRILYGMAGEGNGHATRSRVAIEHLRSRGHDVVVAAPDNAHRVLSKDMPDVLEIVGFTMRYKDGAMDTVRTLLDNLGRAGPMHLHNAEIAREVERRYAPEAAITDLDRFAWQYAKERRLPVVSLDNHIGIARCQAPAPVEGREAVGIGLMQAFVGSLVPDCNRYLATSFVPMSPRADCVGNTRVLPPVLRRALLDYPVPSYGGMGTRAWDPAYGGTSGEVLVYQTSSSDAPALLRTLAALPGTRFVTYGIGADVAQAAGWSPSAMPNVRVAPFGEQEFLRDLVRAPAVVANGGYTLLSECVALGKPVLSVPVRDHAEQSYNASMLQQAGFGARADRHDSDVLASFLRRAPGYAATLASEPRHDANAALYEELDGLFPALPGMQ